MNGEHSKQPEVLHAETKVERISITSCDRGYAHTRLQGSCSADVTVEEIKKEFYHEYFGGRDAWVSNGKWGCVRHDD
jgi:hypothetical protein